MEKHHCNKDGFPWRCHRSLGEVVLTEAMKKFEYAQQLKGRTLSVADMRILDDLKAKERAHNPPQIPPDGERA